MKVSFYLIDILNQEEKKMKTIVRKGVFETNSSSTHTMIILRVHFQQARISWM